MPPADLTYNAFVEHLNQNFRVALHPSGEVILVLRQATQFAPPEAGEQFSVLFVGPREQPLGQGTYTFEHPELGDQSLFIVPISLSAEGAEYEAAFTRLPQAADPIA